MCQRWWWSFRTVAFCLVMPALLGACHHENKDVPKPEDSTRFTWHSPKRVFLAGQFNDWSPIATPMHRVDADHWIVDLPLPPGKYEYKFVIEGQWEQDLANSETVPDGWGGLNSVVTVPPKAPANENGSQAGGTTMRSAIRPEPPWRSIQYPYFDIPGAPGRTITGRLSPGRDGDGRPGEILFRLIFTQLTGEETPSALVHPQNFVVRLHLEDGSVINGKVDPEHDWTAFGNASGMTKERVYTFPATRNAYDEGWIEWRLDTDTFWFEVPYGFTRDPAQAWPPRDTSRSEPRFASAMKNLGSRDKLVQWRFVEYDFGEIQAQWKLTARFGSRGAEVILYHPPDGQTKTWLPDKPLVKFFLRGEDEGGRVAFRRQGNDERVDTFRAACGGMNKGRETGRMVIQVDDRSYEVTVPSSLFTCGDGRVEPENSHWLAPPRELFEELIRAANEI